MGAKKTVFLPSPHPMSCATQQGFFPQLVLNSGGGRCVDVFPARPVILVETVKVTLSSVLMVCDVLCCTLYIISSLNS